MVVCLNFDITHLSPPSIILKLINKVGACLGDVRSGLLPVAVADEIDQDQLLQTVIIKIYLK